MIVDFERLNVVYLCRDVNYNIVVGYLLNDELCEVVTSGSNQEFRTLELEFREYIANKQN